MIPLGDNPNAGPQPTDPEPPDTRMQVVQGASSFSFDFVVPNLPPASQRRALTLHWPKWLDGDHWRFWYTVDVADYSDEVTVASISFWPDGHAMMFLNTEESETVKSVVASLGALEPREMFERFGDVFGAPLIEHLRKVTERRGLIPAANPV